MSTQPLARSPLDRGRLRARLAAGEATFGTFVGAASPVTAEVCAAAGVDWILLDLEHGLGGEEQLRLAVPAAAAYGVPTLSGWSHPPGSGSGACSTSVPPG